MFANPHVCAAVVEGRRIGAEVHLTQGDLALLAEVRRGGERRRYVCQLHQATRDAVPAPARHV
jgi:hypothetical protein